MKAVNENPLDLIFIKDKSSPEEYRLFCKIEKENKVFTSLFFKVILLSLFFKNLIKTSFFYCFIKHSIYFSCFF